MAFKEKEEKELQELSPGRLQNSGTEKHEDQDGRLARRGWQGRTKTPARYPGAHENRVFLEGRRGYLCWRCSYIEKNEALEGVRRRNR